MMNSGICIFGGSFDPVHKGHVKLAKYVCDTLKLRKMLIIPAAMSPFKNSSGATEDDRMKMCELSFSDDIFSVSDIEIKRGGKSYTIDTVNEIKALYPDEKLYLLIGSDQFLSFNRWYKFDEILKNVTLVSVVRDGENSEEDLKRFAAEKLDIYGETLVLTFSPFEISSTEIRKKAAAGEDFSSFVGDEVYAYIKEKGLYKNV